LEGKETRFINRRKDPAFSFRFLQFLAFAGRRRTCGQSSGPKRACVYGSQRPGAIEPGVSRQQAAGSGFGVLRDRVRCHHLLNSQVIAENAQPPRSRRRRGQPQQGRLLRPVQHKPSCVIHNRSCSPVKVERYPRKRRRNPSKFHCRNQISSPNVLSAAGIGQQQC
jgi:hypothetical protein